MRTSLSVTWAPKILSLLRIVAGFLFLAHGLEKHFGVPEAGHTVSSASMPGIGGWIELICGALILLGLFTRVAAFIASGEMAVAYLMVHAPHGFWPIVNKGELAVLYCFVFLYLAVAGGGEWSLDRLWHRRRF